MLKAKQSALIDDGDSDGDGAAASKKRDLAPLGRSMTTNFQQQQSFQSREEDEEEEGKTGLVGSQTGDTAAPAPKLERLSTSSRAPPTYVTSLDEEETEEKAVPSPGSFHRRP